MSNQINKNAKLCVLQHGYGNMFLGEDFWNAYLDRKISDIYLSWGGVKRKKNIPFFIQDISSEIKNYKFNTKKKNFITYLFF